jgi:hypothetical protein
MRPQVPRFTRVVLCLLFLGAAQETLLHAPRPTSPHWNHMKVLDYGWGAWNIADASTRRRAYDWLASKTDITMGPAAELKRTNPAIKTVSYDLDISICRHDDCYWEHGPNDQAAGLPEEFFLHFSQPTQLTFKGQDNRQLETVHIAGCPPGTSVNKACRVQFFMWTDSRWIFNPANENFRKWMAHRLASNAADVLFLDEHAPRSCAADEFGRRPDSVDSRGRDLRVRRAGSVCRQCAIQRGSCRSPGHVQFRAEASREVPVGQCSRIRGVRSARPEAGRRRKRRLYRIYPSTR